MDSIEPQTVAWRRVCKRADRLGQGLLFNTMGENQKAIKLFKKVNQIAKSKKIDSEKTYVSFKNNCGNAFYDDFRICDVRTGYIIYTITPSYPDGKGNTNADVWGKENNFDEALVKGNWKDVVKFFNS